MLKRYSYLPGFVLIVVALVRVTLRVAWDGPTTALAGAGSAIVIAGLVWNWREVRAWLADPRGIFAVSTALTAILVTGILALVNVIVWYRPAEIDLTMSDRNTIAAESRDLVSRLEKDVVFRQFGRTRDPKIDQLLNALAGAGSRIGVEFEDVERNPQAARQFGVIRPGTVIVEAATAFRKIEDVSEQALLTALLQVTSETQHVVCVVTGHGERGIADTGGTGLSRLAEALDVSNYRVESVSLLDEDGVSGCSVVMLAGPTRELQSGEIERLERYANRGGRLAILLDPQTTLAPGEGPRLPNSSTTDLAAQGATSLGAWVQTWGIQPDDGVLVDESGAGRSVGGGPTTPLAQQYNDHPIVRGFNVATLYGDARPLTILEHSLRGGTPVAVALTGPRSYVERTPASAFAFDAGVDLRGPSAMVAATEVKVTQPKPNPPATSRLLVAGDADFISNALVNRQGNRDFFLRAVSWLAGEAEATIVKTSERENRRIDLTERMRLWMYAVNIGLLPLLPLTAGVVWYLRSRR